MIVEYDCEFCGKHVRKQQVKGMNHRFCSRTCKAEWQLTQKPVTKEWLYEKYIIEGLDCTQIAKLVNRNSKRVWEWLKEHDIPTRKRGENKAVHFKRGQDSAFKGHRHSEDVKQKIRQARIDDGYVPYKLKDGTHAMKGRKGKDHPKWKGGFTPERNAFYGSQEWKEAIKAVWKRDNATCQKCGLHKSKARELDFDIHHIVSFSESVELRCELSNLVLLCEPCHYWIHSKANINKEWIK